MAIIQRPVQLQQLSGGPNFGQAIKAGLAGLQMGQQLGQRAQQQQQQQQLFDQQQAQFEQQQATRALQGQAIAGEQLLGAQSLAEAQAAISPLVDANPEAAALLEGLQGGQITLDQAKQTASQALQGANAMGIFTPMQMRQQAQQQAQQEALAKQAESQLEFQRKQQIERIKQEPKIAERAEKRAKAKAERAEDLTNKRREIATRVGVVRELLNHPGRTKATGKSSIIPTVAGSDARNFKVKFESFINDLALGETKKISGPLSDSDIELLRKAASGLDLGMSEKAFENRLRKLESGLLSGIQRSERGLARLDIEDNQFEDITSLLGASDPVDRIAENPTLRRQVARNRGRDRNGATQEFVSPGGVNFTVSQL